MKWIMEWNNGSNEVTCYNDNWSTVQISSEIAWHITSFRSVRLLPLWLFGVLILDTSPKRLSVRKSTMKDYIIIFCAFSLIYITDCPAY